MRSGAYLAVFDRGTREPHPFRVWGDDDTKDDRALRLAAEWHHFSELFRRTDTGYVRVG